MQELGPLSCAKVSGATHSLPFLGIAEVEADQFEPKTGYFGAVRIVSYGSSTIL